MSDIPGGCVFLVGTNMVFPHGDHRTIATRGPAKTAPTIVTRIDFNTRTVTFWVDGVEAKPDPLVTLPGGEGPYFVVVTVVNVDDEVETLSNDDPAFDVLFSNM